MSLISCRCWCRGLAFWLVMGQLAACSSLQTYPGPRLPAAQAAVLRNEAGGTTPASGGSIYVDIIAVDGRPVDDDRTRGLQILPGKRRLTIRTWEWAGVLFWHHPRKDWSTTQLEFFAEKGKIYVLRLAPAYAMELTPEGGWKKKSEDSRCVLYVVEGHDFPYQAVANAIVPGCVLE